MYNSVLSVHQPQLHAYLFGSLLKPSTIFNVKVLWDAPLLVSLAWGGFPCVLLAHQILVELRTYVDGMW
jgi:hypothetical protein